MQVARHLLNNLDGLILAVVLASWQFLTKTPLTVRVALTVAGLYFVLSLVWAIERRSAGAAPTETKKRDFVDDPSAVLHLAHLTGFDAVRHLTPFLGRWITISGAYEGIAESLQQDSIHLSLRLNDGRRINLRFSLDHAEQLRRFRAGQPVTVIGQIPHSGSAFIPENCELVRAGRSTLAYAS